MKAKVLLAPNQPGWAFDHRARDLISLQLDRIRFDLKYLRNISSRDQHSYDMIYPMTLEGAKILYKEQGIPLNKMATGITSLRSIEKYRIDSHNFDPSFIRFINKLRGINTASNEIVSLFRPLCSIYKTRVGIHEAVFKPGQTRDRKRKFRVGWVGRIDKPCYRQLKGYDIVLNALRGLELKLDIRTYKEHYVPREKMVQFYQGLDCFICSSQSEHIPLPILEAAACGIPIITTNVGIVPELIQHKKNGIIVPRTSEAIHQAVANLIEKRKNRIQLGQNVRATIMDQWTWEKCKKDWETFFISIL
jgi:glycosyltransferase involved in cell wall biosynthesis